MGDFNGGHSSHCIEEWPELSAGGNEFLNFFQRAVAKLNYFAWANSLELAISRVYCEMLF